MKKLPKTTKDGKKILAISFCHQAQIFYGMIQVGNTNKSALWSKDGKHIKANSQNLNIAV